MASGSPEPGGEASGMCNIGHSRRNDALHSGTIRVLTVSATSGWGWGWGERFSKANLGLKILDTDHTLFLHWEDLQYWSYTTLGYTLH